MIGLVGKLPAHGDFVRRGGPASVLAALDRWLDAELSRAPELAERLDALDGLRFAVTIDGEAVLGTMLASEDRVGRHFPLIATLAGRDLPEPAEAERWSEDAYAALRAARDGGMNGDEAAAAIDALPRPVAGPESPRSGWWRAGGEGPVGDPSLPSGPAFAVLFGEPAA